jgi:hypothetical protein
MKKTAGCFLALAVALVVSLPAAAAKTWEVSAWSGWWGLKYAVDNANDGDIIELQNNLTVNDSVSVDKKIVVRSKGGERYTISNQSKTYKVTVNPGGTLTLTNVVYDGMRKTQIQDAFHLAEMEVSKSNKQVVTNVSRLVLDNGATIQNVYISANTKKEEYAVIHVKKGAVLRINKGAAILNCRNESNPGKGGAVCCDNGTVIMTGGTIAGCTAKGAGGAIHTDGTRVDNADNYGISSRGDIYLSGGYITNNTCGAGLYGGGIYLGNSGPMLHITGDVVVSNNFSGAGTTRISDDVSTYLLQNAWANRLKLVNHTDINPPGFSYEGIRFTGSVGVRYPDTSETTDPQQTRFGGIWEYFNGTQEEPRQFFWNGNTAYRGSLEGNALVWSTRVAHELPRDGKKIAELIAAGESPIYIELTANYEMTQPAWMPAGCELVIDLQGFDLKCDFHVTNETSKVIFRDSSERKSGTVSGHRESDFPTAFVLEGGSYQTEPKPEWVPDDRIVIRNYCTEHPYMVAIKVWEAEHERTVTDLTKVALETTDTEVRTVSVAEDGATDIGPITFSTGDWKFMQYTNRAFRAQVFAVAAVSNKTTGVLSEVGERILLFDTDTGLVSTPKPGNDELSPPTLNVPPPIEFGSEDDFDWGAQSYGLVKLIHITLRERGERYETNDTEVAYFRFPDPAFRARQRMTGSFLPITIVDQLLASFGFNRVHGFPSEDVDERLDHTAPNGLRYWENLVTGTAADQLLLSTARESGDGLTLKIALADKDEKKARTDTGYFTRYVVRRSTPDGWINASKTQATPDFDIPLLDAEGKSRDASGFYRLVTLIIPEDHPTVTNEIPSRNIVGVLEVKSAFTNTLSAVPWVSFAAKNATEPAGGPMTVAGYVHTPHLTTDDSVQIADKGHIYRRWHWKKNPGSPGAWDGAVTVTREALHTPPAASEQELPRTSAAWVSRSDPGAKPFFLIGQYASGAQTLTVNGAPADVESVCTLVPNPSLEPVTVNAYAWGTNPRDGDLVRIPNEKTAPVNLLWNAQKKAWGRYVKQPGSREGVWKTDDAVPAGMGFWYMRKGGGGAFDLTLPHSAPVSEE